MKVTAADFRHMMENLRKPLSDHDIEEMIKDADPNHTGYITYNGKNRIYIVSRKIYIGYHVMHA